MFARFLLLILVLALTTSATERTTVRWPGLPEGWTVYATRIPLSVRFVRDGAATDEYAKGVTVLPGSESDPVGSRLLEVGGLMKEIGVEPSPGASAVYNEQTSSLVVIGPKDVVEMLEVLCTPTCVGPNFQIKIVATLVQFRVKRGTKVRELSYARLRSVAGASWKELERTTLVTKSGQRALAQRTAGEHNPPEDAQAESVSSDAQSKPRLGMGETGTIFEVEPVIGLDGNTIDLNYSWHRRVGQDLSADCMEAVASIALKDDTSTVVAEWPEHAQLNRATTDVATRALVLQVSLVDEQGVTLRDAFLARRRRLRESAKR